MDDQALQILLDALQGKTAEEIEALITSSVNASAVGDPATVAAYLASMLS